jgi:hypothetical protein
MRAIWIGPPFQAGGVVHPQAAKSRKLDPKNKNQNVPGMKSGSRKLRLGHSAKLCKPSLVHVKGAVLVSFS